MHGPLTTEKYAPAIPGVDEGEDDEVTVSAYRHEPLLLEVPVASEHVFHMPDPSQDWSYIDTHAESAIQALCDAASVE